MVASSDTMVFNSPSVIAALKSKHPSAPLDRRNYPIVNPAGASVSVAAAQVSKAVLSFPAGSAGGPDGLSPQHVKDVIRVEGPTGVLALRLSDFTNTVLSGAIPYDVKPLFFGARLFAFQKKDGGIRPIAVGLSLRRLVGKCLCHIVTPLFWLQAGHLQLGVGTKRGLEAGVYAARGFLRQLPLTHAMIKIDFANAFNTLWRDVICVRGP